MTRTSTTWNTPALQKTLFWEQKAKSRLLSLLEDTIQQYGEKKKVFHSMNFSSILPIRHKALFLFYLLSLSTFYLLCLSLICICLERWQIFTERVLCVRPWSSSCGYIRQQNTVTSLRKLMFWRKTDTDSSQNKQRRDCGRRCCKREVGGAMRKCHPELSWSAGGWKSRWSKVLEKRHYGLKVRRLSLDRCFKYVSEWSAIFHVLK